MKSADQAASSTSRSARDRRYRSAGAVGHNRRKRKGQADRSAQSATRRAPKGRAPKVGDSRPAPPVAHGQKPKIGDSRAAPADSGSSGRSRRGRRRGGRGRGGRGGRGSVQTVSTTASGGSDRSQKRNPGKRKSRRTRRGQPLGRYSMYVHVGIEATHIAVLEGRRLLEYFVSRPSDDVTEIHGNIYLGRVQNVLPGMETAFVDIGTPKNAVLYSGDVKYDDSSKGKKSSSSSSKAKPRIEDVLKDGQSVLCQVVKNPIGPKGARLVQEISLAGRCVVLVPNSPVLGISKRLPDRKSKQLRAVLELIQPEGHGLILRTAAENVTVAEIANDVERLVQQWQKIQNLAESSTSPALLYREPEATLRLIREEFTPEFRNVTIDSRDLYEEVADYISTAIPELADRVGYYDEMDEKLSLLERYCVIEQLYKALSPKVWLPSGGSIIIEHTEALTVVDVNTSKNVGKSNLEDTVLANNLEAADELARQLRLRDIGGIIVVDFVDMEVPENRAKVVKRFKDALARDKTRTQVLDISSLGLLQMTRKRIGGGLLESLSAICEPCAGNGWHLLDDIFD